MRTASGTGPTYQPIPAPHRSPPTRKPHAHPAGRRKNAARDAVKIRLLMGCLLLKAARRPRSRVMQPVCRAAGGTRHAVAEGHLGLPVVGNGAVERVGGVEQPRLITANPLIHFSECNFSLSLLARTLPTDGESPGQTRRG